MSPWPSSGGHEILVLALPAPEVGFKGPLNLLTTLARREELDVLQLSLADLVDSFRDGRETDADLQRLGEFLTGLGFLLRRKIRRLFPGTEIDEEPTDEPELAVEPVLPMVVSFLEERWRLGRRLYGRRPPAPVRRVWTEAGVGSLATLAVTLPPPVPEAPTLPSLWRERRSLEEEILGLASRLRAGQEILISGTLSAVDLGGFLGALELTRRREASLHQAETFGPITVVRVEEG